MKNRSTRKSRKNRESLFTGTILFLIIVPIIATQLGCGSSTEFKNGGAEGPEEGYAKPELLISTEALSEILDDPAHVIIDVRPKEEFRQGHIPGAINLQWTRFTHLLGPKFWQLLPLWLVELHLGLSGITVDDTIVLYNDQETGWGEDGRFYSRFFRLFLVDLFFMGQRNVRILNGGWNLWVLEERETTTETAGRRPSRYRAEVRPELLADKSWMTEHYDDPDVHVIDSRSREEYDGAVLYGEARGGHVPGAESLHWRETIGPDYRIRPASELKQALDAVGVTEDAEVVVYCTGGVRSGHLFFVLELLGYPRIRNYDGSFWEWAADPTLPIE
ncbi:sulfurtransferase [Thermodesulfobacteriota bacterium]